MGRPKKITAQVLGKLKEAFLLGCTDREACFYAEINPDTLYAYQKENPTFSDQKESFKSNPILLARKTVINALKDNPMLALKYLERKQRSEFSLLQKVDITSDSKPIPILGGISCKID